MLATSPPRIFKIDLSKRVSELARHLATTDFLIHMIQRETVWICLPPRHQWLFYLYGSKKACLNMLATSAPMIFKNDFSKQVLVMARHLATREFWIHIYQRESVWIGPPPRHQRFFKNDLWLFDSYGSTRACFDMIATSPPELFELILFQEKFFGYACNLDTNDFEELSLKVYILSGLGPCHQSLTIWGQIEGYRKFDSSPPFFSEACKSHMLWIFWI